MAYPQSEYQVVTKLNVPTEYKSSGFVYVMENENMPGIYKIGMTTNSPEARAKELSSATGVPSPFSVLAAFHSQNPRVDEKLVLNRHAFNRHLRVI
ncbi:GIY-YIG nuclease family protein [Enterobacter kobei]|uniref:GIY-YIG nuclease family protein n=1 Tax=Enterobacter kobei TaxID=208224 RepID=UPI00069E3549|nr:GIY-YIG nuclease family protein [Enterobacter kobei]